MKLKKKIFLLCIFAIVICLGGVYSTNFHENTNAMPVVSNQTDGFGCCSIIIQLNDNESLLSYRRDSDSYADIHIEEIDWHGLKAIKQYKTEGGYFNHVIITQNGWIIGFGGIDDGDDSKHCEEIAAGMINDNYTINNASLNEIKDIKQAYGRGHFIIKAPNGNYGFATPTVSKTGTLEKDEYISVPNDYQFTRRDVISINQSDKIDTMIKLAQTDAYGLDRRGISVYDFQVGSNANTTSIYVSNEDGSYFDMDNTGYIDDYIFKNTTIKAKDIPIAPEYKEIGNVTFDGSSGGSNNTLLVIGIIIGVLIFIAVLFFVVLRLVRHIRYKIRR